MKLKFFKSQRDFMNAIINKKVTGESLVELPLSEGYKKHGGDLYLIEYNAHNFIYIIRGKIVDNQFIDENDEDHIYDLPCEGVALYQMKE